MAFNILDFDEQTEGIPDLQFISDFINANTDGFILRIVVERAHHWSDLTFNYLKAAFIGQKCADFAKRLSYRIRWDLQHHPVAELGLKPYDSEGLIDCIYKIALSITEEDPDEYMYFLDEMEEFQEQLGTIKVVFHELADDYAANRLNGQYYEFEREDMEDNDDTHKGILDNEFKKFPERAFGFWRSFGATADQPFYVSTTAWIIPSETNFNEVIREHSGMSSINFEKADLFVMNNISYLIGQGMLIHFSFGGFIAAKACAYHIAERPTMLYSHSWMNDLLTHRESPLTDASDEDYKASLNLIPYAKAGENEYYADQIEYFISEFGDQILVRDGGFSYVFWYTKKPQLHELLLLNQKLSLLFQTSATLAGLSADIRCNWAILNDEKFEELCYDILYSNPTYDSDRIRKMGKSRSRDGGRDLEVWTRSRPHYQSEKYIFQCKFLLPGKSLSASRIHGVSDLVEEYGAAGYGVMTNAVIDPTLYDKLDRIGARKGIIIEDYSIYQLERILSRYPSLKERHFGTEE